MAEIMVFKRPTLRQLILFFSSSYLFTYVHSSWIETTSTYFCLLGVHFFTFVTESISFYIVKKKSEKERIYTVSIKWTEYKWDLIQKKIIQLCIKLFYYIIYIRSSFVYNLSKIILYDIQLLCNNQNYLL